MLKNIPAKHFYSALIIIILAASIVVINFFAQKPETTNASTNTFSQTDWTGGANTTTAANSTSTWNNYFSQSNIVATSSLGLATSLPSFGSRTDITTSTASGNTVPKIIFVTSTGIIYAVYQSSEFSALASNIALRTSTNGAA